MPYLQLWAVGLNANSRYPSSEEHVVHPRIAVEPVKEVKEIGPDPFSRRVGPVQRIVSHIRIEIDVCAKSGRIFTDEPAQTGMIGWAVVCIPAKQLFTA